MYKKGSDQSSWLQIRRPGFDSRHYQKKKVVGLERGSLSFVSTIEELLERKTSGSCLENRDYGRRGSATLTTRHPTIRKKLALISPTRGGGSVRTVRSRTKATELLLLLLLQNRMKSLNELEIIWMKASRASVRRREGVRANYEDARTR
jgi:hypothetical protein